MNPSATLGPETVSLAEFTNGERKRPVINWYRTPLAPADMKSLHRRSDALGFLQAGGYTGLVLLTGTAAFYSAGRWPWGVTAGLVFLHGTVCSFLINGVHELGHGTVFKTKWLNTAFCRLLAFIGWINHEKFHASHTRHHRYTLHPPDDLEVVLPQRLMFRHVLKTGIVNPLAAWRGIKDTFRVARGRFEGEWELTLFPKDDPEKSRSVIRWARFLLVGHGVILIVSLGMGWWILPLLVSATPAYGGWLFFLCNNTQHIGLQDNVPDFRLCCRTFTLNPLVRFLYWQMNYHTEHHMYAAVPCYRLGRLHRLIRHDLPPCPDGLAATWRQILAILAAQEKDPSYQFQPVLPTRQPPQSSGSSPLVSSA